MELNQDQAQYDSLEISNPADIHGHELLVDIFIQWLEQLSDINCTDRVLILSNGSKLILPRPQMEDSPFFDLEDGRF